MSKGWWFIMKYIDHLSEDDKARLKKARRRKRNKKRRNVERFSEKDLLSLMGVDRQTYTRGRGGAVKRK